MVRYYMNHYRNCGKYLSDSGSKKRHPIARPNSYGISFVKIPEKFGRVITAPHCIWHPGFDITISANGTKKWNMYVSNFIRLLMISNTCPMIKSRYQTWSMRSLPNIAVFFSPKFKPILIKLIRCYCVLRITVLYCTAFCIGSVSFWFHHGSFDLTIVENSTFIWIPTGQHKRVKIPLLIPWNRVLYSTSRPDNVFVGCIGCYHLYMFY